MPALVDTVLEIDTPEHLAFRARIAGPARRAFAWLVDLLARALILLGVGLGLFLVFGVTGLEGVGQGLLFFGIFLLDWGYFFAWELGTGGRSPGKIALKLRVVRSDGLPVTWRESLLRNLLRAADLVIAPNYVLALGPAVMALDPKFRRLGDFAAGTIVIVEEPAVVTRATAVVVDEALAQSLPSLPSLDRRDLEALELFVNRPHVSDARREELGSIVAAIYARRMGIAPPSSSTQFLAGLWARSQGRGTQRKPQE